MATYTGTSGNDRITGGTGNDFILGSAGNDTIYGMDGADIIMGGAGNDWIMGGNGKDTIYGDGGDDVIIVNDVRDYYSLAGDDISGGSGEDTIAAEATTSSSLLVIKLGKVSWVEVLENRTNKELMVEGAGIIDVSSIGDYESAGGALGQIWGSSTNDTIYGFNFSWHSDTISGAAGNDLIHGMAGDDFLLGMAGNDTLSGGAGNDALAGYTGSDTFLFKYDSDEGNDRIMDFEGGTDRIQLTNTGGGVTFDDLVLTDVGADCRIDLASGTSILIVGVGSAALDAGDFIFS
ncbi:hypothetical protein [Paracoccus sp. pheM1]|uniref:calcium-binding protein n=1 Tax=Paracoccus sp. pheM1 TaxID=2831675 RepID=UPI001BDB90B1|nr:hypothetical protein [Paracoccus sp. pheM1]MBT0779655.1 hypothetical protein [Paracoccus sp. pheM1]